MPMSPGWRFGWEEAAKVVISVSCVHSFLANSVCLLSPCVSWLGLVSFIPRPGLYGNP